MKDAFCRVHPVVELVYFLLVLGFGMFCTNPVCVGLSLLCALAVTRCLAPGSGKLLVYLLPLALLTVVVNPLFSHAGVTVLTYLPGGNPLTLEALCYGLGAGVTLVGVVLWFACCSRVLTSEKLVYLFGRIAPALSLVLSMALGFLPKFLAQLGKIGDARRQMLGEQTQKQGRVRDALTRFSILITWSLEGALDTADSMRSRGYGLPGRRAFSIYRWSRRDLVLLGWLLALGACLVLGFNRLRWSYYPRLTGLDPEPITLCLFAAYAALCLTPAVYGWWEAHRWERLQSGI